MQLKASMHLHKLAFSYISLHAVTWACMQLHKPSCSSMSLHAVQWACMQFLSLSEQLTRISQCLLRMTRIRPRPGILFTLLQHRLETDSSLKVEPLKSGSLFVIMFWFERKLVFSSVSIFGISSQVLMYVLPCSDSLWMWNWAWACTLCPEKVSCHSTSNQCKC